MRGRRKVYGEGKGLSSKDAIGEHSKERSPMGKFKPGTAYLVDEVRQKAGDDAVFALG